MRRLTPQKTGTNSAAHIQCGLGNSKTGISSTGSATASHSDAALKLASCFKDFVFDTGG
jgi:hypothetical protein